MGNGGRDCGERLPGCRRALARVPPGAYQFFMTIIAIHVPDDLGAALQVPPDQLASELAFAAAARLYQEARVSLAKAAEIAGIDRFSFAEQLAGKGIATGSFDEADVESAAVPAR